MNDDTSEIEGMFKSFASNLSWVMTEAYDIHKAYFATDASTLVGALATGSSGASLDTKLTKNQYINMIGFVDQLKNFFGNAAVTPGDYLTNIDQVIYGNAASPAMLSAATESIATRLKVLAQSCLDLFNTSKSIMDFYSNSEIGVLVSGLSGARVVYGATMNATQLTQGITVVEQYKKLINNETVAQGLYSANVAIWKAL